MDAHLLELLLFLGTMSTIAMGAELLLQRGDLKEARSNLSVVLLSGADKVQAETWWQLFRTPTQEAFLRFTLPMGEADPVVIPPEGLAKTREIAVAECSMVKSVEGIGSVDVVSWVLLFNCLSMNNKCDSVAPVVAIQPAPSSGFAYATLWKRYSPAGIVSNTPAAQLFNISLVPVSASNIIKDAKLNLKQAKMKPCTSSPNERLMAAARPPLNTATDVPFVSCYTFQSSKIQGLSSGLDQQFLNGSLSKSDGGCSTKDDVPLLLPRFDGSFLVCRNRFCVNVAYNASACNMTTALSWSLEAVNNRANNPVDTSNSYCSVTVGPYNSSEIWILPEDSDSAPSATSKQFASEGEFCHLGLKTRPEGVGCLDNTCEAASKLDTEILDLQFSGIATDYVDKHRTVFNVDHGQATDLVTITATLLTALLAMVQSTITFTNSELNLLNKLWKRFSNTPNNLFDAAPLTIRLFLMLVNLSLTAALYSPVFAIIATEMERSKTYQSWGMVADDIKVNTDGTILRAIFFAQGRSKYKSIIPLVSGLLCSLSLLIIGWKTLSRCNTVFSMRKLLKEHNPNMNEKLITANSIESNRAEFLALKQSHDALQGEAQSSQSSQQQKLDDTSGLLPTFHDLSDAPTTLSYGIERC